jgi:hypothetical protein
VHLTLRFLFALIKFLITIILYAHRNDGVGVRHFEHSGSILFSSLEFAVWRNLWILGCAFDLEISLRVDNIFKDNN